MPSARYRTWDDLPRLDEVSESLRNILLEAATLDGHAHARSAARADDSTGLRYSAFLRDGRVLIEHFPPGRVSLPLNEPPALDWKPISLEPLPTMPTES